MELALGGQSLQPHGSCRRLLAHAPEAREDLGAVARHPHGELCSVVDHVVGLRVRRSEQLPFPALVVTAGPRNHREPPLGEGIYYVAPRCPRIAPGDDHPGTCVGEHGGKEGRFRLELEDDRNLDVAERPVAQSAANETVEHGRASPHPFDLGLSEGDVAGGGLIRSGAARDSSLNIRCARVAHVESRRSVQPQQHASARSPNDMRHSGLRAVCTSACRACQVGVSRRKTCYRQRN